MVNNVDSEPESYLLLRRLLRPAYLTAPAHDKTYNKTCVTSKDAIQPVHPPGMATVLVHPSFDIPEAVEGTCDQRRL